MRILTVDDSRAIRSIVAKSVREMGGEVVEAADGEEGLTKLAGGGFDVIVLDVTMPVLDGPGMLKRLREGGDKTPVLMLTSESQRSVIADCMRLGISDYVLKPFKGEELVAKINKAAGAAKAVAAKKSIDLLVVDAREAVFAKLRALVPARVTVESALTPAEAIAHCRTSQYAGILVDRELGNDDAPALLGQLRLVAPRAKYWTMRLKTADDARSEALHEGWAGLLFRPFDPIAVADMLDAVLPPAPLVVGGGGVLRVSSLHPDAPRALRDRFFGKLAGELSAAVGKLAPSCNGAICLDLTEIPAAPEHVPALVAATRSATSAAACTLSIRGSPALDALLALFEETRGLVVPADQPLAQTGS